MRTRFRPRILAAIALVVVAGGIVAIAVQASDDGEATPTTTTRPGPLEEAVLRSEVEIDGVEPDDLGSMIQDLCASRDGDVLAEQVVATGVTDETEIRTLIEGVGRGALSYCPEVPADAPQLLNDAFNAAILLLQE